MSKIKYTDEPIGEVKVIEDFLPSPDELVRFDELLAKTRQAAKKVGLTKKDLKDAIKEIRK
jgi:hypothetical protein